MTDNSNYSSSSLNVLAEKSGRQESGSKDNKNNGSGVKNQTENCPTNNTRNSKVDDSQIHNKDENPQLFPHYSYRKPFQGKAIFVVNKTFVNKRFEVREGAENELSYLQSVFVEKLGFKQINRDNDFDIKIDELDSFLNKETIGNPDCFVFAMCTHGEQIEGPNGSVEQVLVFKDGKYTSTTEIIKKCSECKSLDGKPKIFLIQACRTPKNSLPFDERIYDPGHKVTVTKEGKETSEERPADPGLEPTVTKELQKLSIEETIDGSKRPQDAGDSKGYKDQADSYPSTPNFTEFQSNMRCPNDCLVLYAIAPGKVAFRDKTYGSWMIYYLKELIDQYNQSQKIPFFDVVTKIAFKMAEKETDTDRNDATGNTDIKPVSHGTKAVCVMQHRLTRDLIFPPRMNDLINTQDR